MASDLNKGKGQEMNQLDKLPSKLPAKYLKAITKDFSSDRVLGSSVFGTLYQGILEDGSSIAVKKFAQDALMPLVKIFETEVANHMAFQHNNIVELMGYCCESQKDAWLLTSLNTSYGTNTYLMELLIDAAISLDWDTRFKIIDDGICQGVRYLHNRPEGPLIHMNLTPSSIWLDDNWVPKIADFGLSRIFGDQVTRINTIHVTGKNGYMAPEYLYRCEISTKSDIYSLGMLIIEITTGERNCGNADDRAARNFVDRVRRIWETEENVTSEGRSLDIYGLLQVKACIKIGIKCVEAERNKRPSTDYIVHKLQGEYIRIFDAE